MKVTVVYPVHNRLEYNMMTLPALIYACELAMRFSNDLENGWDIELIIWDDLSTDGTSEFIESLLDDISFPSQYIRDKAGNSITALNFAIEKATRDGFEFIIKIDNDIWVPDFAILFLIEEMMEDDFGGVGFLMPIVSDDIDNDAYLDNIKVNHTGGVGIFRTEVFKQFGPVTSGTLPGEERYFGFTAYQERVQRESEWMCYRIRNTQVCDLDRSPIYSRVEQYKAEGWSRNIVGRVDSIFNRPFLKQEA